MGEYLIRGEAAPGERVTHELAEVGEDGVARVVLKAIDVEVFGSVGEFFELGEDESDGNRFAGSGFSQNENVFTLESLGERLEAVDHFINLGIAVRQAFGKEFRVQEFFGLENGMIARGTGEQVFLLHEKGEEAGLF